MPMMSPVPLSSADSAASSEAAFASNSTARTCATRRRGCATRRGVQAGRKLHVALPGSARGKAQRSRACACIARRTSVTSDKKAGYAARRAAPVRAPGSRRPGRRAGAQSRAEGTHLTHSAAPDLLQAMTLR